MVIFNSYVKLPEGNDFRAKKSWFSSFPCSIAAFDHRQGMKIRPGHRAIISSPADPRSKPSI